MVQQILNLTIASTFWDLITALSQLMFISVCELTRLKPQDLLDMIGPLTLKNEKEVSEKFKLQLTNRFSILQTENVEEENNASYINFETEFHDAAEIFISKKPVAKRKKPWENDRITQKRKKA